MFPKIYRYNHPLAAVFVFSFLAHIHTMKALKSIKYERRAYTGVSARAR